MRSRGMPAHGTYSLDKKAFWKMKSIYPRQWNIYMFTRNRHLQRNLFFSISCVHTTSCKEFSWSIFACSIHPIFPLWIPNWNIDNRVPPPDHFPASIVANCLQVMRKKGLNVWKVRSSFVKRKKRRQWPSGMVMRDGSWGYLHYVGYHIVLGKSPWTIGSTEVWFDTKSQGCTCKEILAAFWKGSKRPDI